MTQQSENYTGFWNWFDGGYNMPSNTKIDSAKGLEETIEEQKNQKIKPLGFLSWFFSGAFNMPSEEKISRATAKVKELPPPSGIWAYLSGGYNVPKLRNKRK